MPGERRIFDIKFKLDEMAGHEFYFIMDRSYLLVSLNKRADTALIPSAILRFF
jgi:hypothetical protein